MWTGPPRGTGSGSPCCSTLVRTLLLWLLLVLVLVLVLLLLLVVVLLVVVLLLSVARYHAITMSDVGSAVCIYISYAIRW